MRGHERLYRPNAVNRGEKLLNTIERESSKLLERITLNSDVCHGKSGIRGLRYPVDMILKLPSAGRSNEEILGDYDDLKPEDILAALAFAARLSHMQRVRLCCDEIGQPGEDDPFVP